MSRLAVLCDPDGCIGRVLTDDAKWLASDAVGSPMSWLLSDHAIAGFYELIALLVDEPALCDWVLDFERAGANVEYYLSGARADRQILLVCGRQPLASMDWSELLASDDNRVASLMARIVRRADDQAARLIDLQYQVSTLRAQIQSTERLENELIRVAAHDLRNPILVMRMNGSFLLQHGDGLSDSNRGVVQEMLETCNFMDRYLDGMTSVSQIWRGALQLDRRTIDGARLLAQIARECADVAAVRDIAIELVRADAVGLRVDVRKLTRVLHELLGNAVTHCESGALIEVRLVRSADRARIHIDDNGPGIPPAILEALFRPFGKSPGSNHRGYGAGVGLSIARRIIEAHGGTLQVASDGGAGTRVTLELPCTELPND